MRATCFAFVLAGCVIATTSGTVEVHRLGSRIGKSTSSAGDADDPWHPPNLIYTNNFNDYFTTQVEVVDVDGDHMPDFVLSWEAEGGDRYQNTWINNGNGWTNAADATEADTLHALAKSPRAVPQVLTLVEATAMLRLSSTRPVEDLIQQQLITARQVDGEWRVSKKEVERFMTVRGTTHGGNAVDAHVQHVLEAAHAEHWVKRFCDYGIDRVALEDLTEADLIEMGITLGDRKRVLRQLSNHR